MDLLVVAAIEAEAAYVPAELPLLVTGVGKTLAAVQVTRTLATHPRRDRLTVVNIGTAGALRDGLGGTFEIGTVLNHDLSAEPIRRLGLDPREVGATAEGASDPRSDPEYSPSDEILVVGPVGSEE